MGLIATGPGSPLAFSSASGGKVYAFNNINETTNTLVAPANTSARRSCSTTRGVMISLSPRCWSEQLAQASP